MKKATFLILSCLTFFVGRSKAVDPGCFYQQHLAPNRVYYVNNPEYPNNYAGAHSCQWSATSDYRIRLNCHTMNLPSSTNCYMDHLDVAVSNVNIHRYCGNNPFILESEGNEMNVTLTSYYWTTGGRFLCEMTAIEKPGSETCRCGWKNPTRIVGGTETGINEYPMMAGLVDFKTKEVFCGATIISQNAAVTAAHCLLNRQVGNLGLLVGDHDISTGADTNAAKLLPLATYVIHQYFNQTGLRNDIALAFTKDAIPFSQQVGPACLPFYHYRDSFIGDYVTTLGWGTLEFGGQKSNTLQKVRLSVIRNDVCHNYYEYVTDGNLCAFEEGKDACQFDSGGPSLWQNPTSGRIVLVGSVSYGKSCADGPGVYTRIGAYVDWITSMTPSTSYCKIE